MVSFCSRSIGLSSVGSSGLFVDEALLSLGMGVLVGFFLILVTHLEISVKFLNLKYYEKCQR